MCVFHCRPCLSQVSQDPTYLHTAIIKCHCQCLLWDSRPSIPPFPKGERLEAEREDKKRKNILYSTSSTNTIPFFLLVTLQHLERSKHRWHAHREGWQIRRRVGLNIYFSFSPSPKLSHVSKALRKKMASWWSSTNINCWLPRLY